MWVAGAANFFDGEVVLLCRDGVEHLVCSDYGKQLSEVGSLLSLSQGQNQMHLVRDCDVATANVA